MGNKEQGFLEGPSILGQEWERALKSLAGFNLSLYCKGNVCLKKMNWIHLFEMYSGEEGKCTVLWSTNSTIMYMGNQEVQPNTREGSILAWWDQEWIPHVGRPSLKPEPMESIVYHSLESCNHLHSGLLWTWEVCSTYVYVYQTRRDSQAWTYSNQTLVEVYDKKKTLFQKRLVEWLEAQWLLRDFISGFRCSWAGRNGEMRMLGRDFVVQWTLIWTHSSVRRW